MPIWIQKISDSGGQYRVTLPKDLIKALGFQKAKVVEIWEGEDDTIHLKEYHAKKTRKRGNKASRSKTN